MTTATLEIYRTESGALYEIAGKHFRRTDSAGAVEDWQPYRSISRLPAAVLNPGQTGEVLEIVRDDGRRLLTSRLITPLG